MARSSLARRLGAATLLTTLVLSSAACGGDDGATATDESSSSDTSSNTDETTDESEVSEPEASGELTELAAEDFYPSVMAALQEAETMGFSISSSGGPTATEMTGVMRYDDEGIDMQASGTGAQPMEMVMLDKVLYISGAGLPLPDGKKWIKVDMTDPNSLFGQLGKATDPSSMFKAMETPKKFELLGTEEIDGVETNHYNVVMDTAAYTEAMELPAEVSKLMPKEIGVEMWVDGDNLPRKFFQELEISTGSGAPITSVTEGTYFDFGTDVDVEAPPAAEVADNIPGMS